SRKCRREVQLHVDVLLLIVFETHGLLTAPSRSGLLRCRILCPMLTSAPRSGRLTATSVAEATRNRSPGVSSVTFRAQSPNLRFAPLMDYGLRGKLPTRPIRAPCIRFLSIDSHVCSMLLSDLTSRR